MTICNVFGCGRRATTVAMCHRHYNARWRLFTRLPATATVVTTEAELRDALTRPAVFFAPPRPR